MNRVFDEPIIDPNCSKPKVSFIVELRKHIIDYIQVCFNQSTQALKEKCNVIAYSKEK